MPNKNKLTTAKILAPYKKQIEEALLTQTLTQAFDFIVKDCAVNITQASFQAYIYDEIDVKRLRKQANTFNFNLARQEDARPIHPTPPDRFPASSLKHAYAT